MNHLITALYTLLFSSVVFSATASPVSDTGNKSEKPIASVKTGPECQIPKVIDSGGGSPAVAKAAQALQNSDPCKVRVKVKSLAQIWDLVMFGKTTGGRRLKPPPPEGLPSGTVYANNNVIQIDFTKALSEGMQSFSISVDGRPLFNYLSPARQVEISMAEFDENHRFTWNLLTREKAYQYEFQLIDAKNRSNVSNRLADLDKEPLDEITRLFFKAAVFNSNDLQFDRDNIIVELRKKLDQ